MNSVNVTQEFWRYLLRKRTKRAEKSLRAMDRDIATAWMDRDTKEVFLEQTSSAFRIPDYLYEEFLDFRDYIRRKT